MGFPGMSVGSTWTVRFKAYGIGRTIGLFLAMSSSPPSSDTTRHLFVEQGMTSIGSRLVDVGDGPYPLFERTTLGRSPGLFHPRVLDKKVHVLGGLQEVHLEFSLDDDILVCGGCLGLGLSGSSVGEHDAADLAPLFFQLLSMSSCCALVCAIAFAVPLRAPFLLLSTPCGWHRCCCRDRAESSG